MPLIKRSPIRTQHIVKSEEEALPDDALSRRSFRNGFSLRGVCVVLRSVLCWSVGVQQINFATFTIGCTFGAVFEIRECVILRFCCLETTF